METFKLASVENASNQGPEDESTQHIWRLVANRAGVNNEDLCAITTSALPGLVPHR